MPLTRLQKCSGSARRALFAQIARRARRAAGACTRRLELSFCFQNPRGKCQQLFVGNLTLLIRSERLVPTPRVSDCWLDLRCSQSEQSGSFHQDVWRRVLVPISGESEAGEGAQIRGIKGNVGARAQTAFFPLCVSQIDTSEPAASACSQVGFLRAQPVVFFAFKSHSPTVGRTASLCNGCSKWCAMYRRYLRECGNSRLFQSPGIFVCNQFHVTPECGHGVVASHLHNFH